MGVVKKMFVRFRLLRMEAGPLLVDVNSPTFIQKVLTYVPSVMVPVGSRGKVIPGGL